MAQPKTQTQKDMSDIDIEERRQKDSLDELIAGQSSKRAREKRQEQAHAKTRQPEDWSML